MIPQPTRAFTKAVSKLDRSEQILVFKTVERLRQSDVEIGKPLNGDLHRCRSIRTGVAGRLRIVFRTETMQVLRLLVVGPRERSSVCIQAVQVLKQLEQ